MTEGFRIEKLRREHPVDGFSCGRDELERFLMRYALGNQQADARADLSRAARSDVIGFYSLVVGEVAFADAPERLTKGLARHPVPIMLLARLAVRQRLAGPRHRRGIAEGRHAAHAAGGGDRRHPRVRRACQGRIGATVLRAFRFRGLADRSAAPVPPGEGFAAAWPGRELMTPAEAGNERGGVEARRSKQGYPRPSVLVDALQAAPPAVA